MTYLLIESLEESLKRSKNMKELSKELQSTINIVDSNFMFGTTPCTEKKKLILVFLLQVLTMNLLRCYFERKISRKDYLILYMLYTFLS